MYAFDHLKEMSTEALASMLASLLYYKRFFPYYVSNVLAGLDKSGKGVAYHYDPVGSYEVGKYFAGGSSSALLQPLLDNKVSK